MPSHRSLRMAEAIREVVSNAILFEVSDPRVKGVTVLHVEVAGDLRSATAFVSIMGTPAEQENAMRGPEERDRLSSSRSSPPGSRPGSRRSSGSRRTRGSRSRSRCRA